MSTALTVQQESAAVARRDTSELSEIQRLGNLLSASGYFSDVRDMAQAAVKVMAGGELGVPPIASMMGINIIKGKVAMGAHLIASRVRAHGYEFEIVTQDATGCSIRFLGKPASDGKRKVLGESSFNEADAKTAGVFSDMYRKYPRNMYYARAMSNGAKWFTPDVLAGMPVYVPEELGAKVDGEGEVIHETPKPQEVAEQKIAEMKAGRPYQEITEPPMETGLEADAPPPPEQADANISKRLEQFNRMKGMLGNADYYRILGGHGYCHANEVWSLVEARKIFREMAVAYDDRMKAAGVKA